MTAELLVGVFILALGFISILVNLFCYKLLDEGIEEIEKTIEKIFMPIELPIDNGCIETVLYNNEGEQE